MGVDKDELLSKLKELLKGEVSTISYDTWFAPLGIDSIKDNHIVFTATSEFQQDFIENKFNSLIFNTLRFITNKEWTFSVIDLSKEENTNQNIIADKNSNVTDAELETNHQTIDPKYTFETFVVGNNNRFAHAAALAVGNEPGESYNPLFLYGGVGLGKTHLMQAIGNRILENNPKSNVLYVTSEKFTNQLINAIRDGKTEMFRNKYRNIDVLLIDDIQFIAGSNIRELEGVFNKIVARANLTHSPITIELAENIINEFKYESEKVISNDFIKETIAKYFSIDKDDLSGSKRSNDVAFPRQIAMYLCREVAGMSFPQIGVEFGNRDHSTVIHGYNKIAKEIKEKNSTKLIVESVENIITSEKNK